MKLARLGQPGHEIPVMIEAGTYFDLRGIVDDFADVGGLDRVRDAVASGSLPILAGAEAMRIGPPVLRPSAILCIGLNYAAHAAESGSALPAAPILFLKTPNTVGGPNDDVDIPRKSVKTDWEVELAVLIGRRALYLDSPAESAAHVAGYLVANDVSEREFQIELSGGQWSKGKSAPGFSPLGPWLVTPDEVDPGNLRLRSWVNGEPRQDSTTADLIFDVNYIIWHLSQFMALEPGDVIMTGTPAGVALSGKFPYLREGDVVELEVEGLGRQRQVYRQA